MKIWTSPKVTTVGKWVFQGHPEYAVPADGDNVTQGLAFAAKGCYKSFGADGRACVDNQRGILAHGHGCYDEETQVLTDEGWKFWPDVTGLEQFYTLNSRGRVELQAARAKTSYRYSGKMYRVESSMLDLLVTPNHRMYVCPTTTKEGRKKDSFEFITAEELDTISHAYTKTSDGWESDLSESDIFFEFLGFAIGDAHISERYAEFNLRKPRKVRYLSNLVEKLGHGFRLLGEGLVYIPTEYRESFYKTYGDNNDRVVPFIPRNTGACSSLLRGLIESDGHRSRTGIRISTVSRQLADSVQTLAMLCGMSCNIKISDNRDFAYGDRPVYVCHLITRNNKPTMNKAEGYPETKWVDFDGMVYCVEVPNNTLYVRRNDKPVWCGNSVLEHASLTLYVEGVSRALTLEMNRHRPFGISQESTRYVDESNSGIVLEPYLATLYERIQKGWATEKEERLVRSHLNWSEVAIEEYEREVRWLEELNPLRLEGFDLRKWARGKARNVLPHNLESKVTYTGNLRCWRHFLETRSTRHAEPEIRRLSAYIYDELVKYAPLYFDDLQYTINMYPETDIKWYPMYPEYVPTHRKV